MSEKHTGAPKDPQPDPTAEPSSIIQPIIDDLKKAHPLQVPIDDEAPPPRGPIHPSQPVEQQ